MKLSFNSHPSRNPSCNHNHNQEPQPSPSPSQSFIFIFISAFAFRFRVRFTFTLTMTTTIITTTTIIIMMLTLSLSTADTGMQTLHEHALHQKNTTKATQPKIWNNTCHHHPPPRYIYLHFTCTLPTHGVGHADAGCDHCSPRLAAPSTTRSPRTQLELGILRRNNATEVAHEAFHKWWYPKVYGLWLENPINMEQNGWFGVPPF